MKVLHAAETIKGGVATVIRQLALAGNASGMESSCFVPKNQVSEVSEVDNLKTLTFPRSGRNVRSLMRFAIGLVWSVYIAKPDVIHFHSTFSGALGRPLIKLLFPFRQIRLIYSPHAWAFIMDDSEIKKIFYAALERTLVKITDAVVCVSRFELEAARERGIVSRKLHVVYNGVESPEAVPGVNRSVSERVNLLYVGRFDRQKGFDLLVDAMFKLDAQRFHLTAVGDVVNEATLPPDLPNISYKGWVGKKELACFYSAADVLVMPSRWEAFGLTAVEAQSYGLPVLASDCTALPEVVEDGRTGKLFTSGDAAELLQIISETSRYTWRSMAVAAISNYRRNFQSERMCAAIFDIYKGRVGEVSAVRSVVASAVAVADLDVALENTTVEYPSAKNDEDAIKKNR